MLDYQSAAPHPPRAQPHTNRQRTHDNEHTPARQQKPQAQSVGQIARRPTGQTARPAQPRTQPPHTPWILGSIAFLWCFVLPFICWGAWAAPGHAHSGPHIVFAPPPQPSHHPPISLAPAGQATAVSHEQPTGAARPDSLILSLLLLVLLRLWQIPHPRRHTQPAPPRSLGAQPIWPTVPTPPPRRLSTACTPRFA